MTLFDDDRKFLEGQLVLIEKAFPILKELLETTQEDRCYGRGFSSIYPNQSINLLKIMKFGIGLELGIE
jgi:hypothetical protein